MCILLHSTGNEYIFYLVIALASGTGCIPKPSVVTRSRAAGVATGDTIRQKKSIRGAVTDEVPIGVTTTSHFKRKSVNMARLGMLPL